MVPGARLVKGRTARLTPGPRGADSGSFPPRFPWLPRTRPDVRRLFPAAAAALLLALGACDLVKVERTPRGFYTQRDPARIDQQEAANEIRARVRNFAEELARGNRARALTAINPTDDVLVIGSDASGGVARIGPRGLADALDSIVLATPALARTPDLRVQVGLREQTGWFSTPIEFMSAAGTAQAQWLRASGVFSQDGGEWRLVQIHLSRPFVASDTSRADSARRAQARGDSAHRATRRSPPARPTSRPRG
jgi:hypothetical protein